MNLWLLSTTNDSNAVVITTFIRNEEKIVITQAYKFAAISCESNFEPDIELHSRYQAFGTEHDWRVEELLENYFSSWDYDGNELIVGTEIEDLLSKGIEEVEKDGWVIYDQELWLNSPLDLRQVQLNDD